MDDDVDPLHRDPAAGRGAALDHQQAAAPRGPRRLARVALDDHRPGDDVLGHADARSCPRSAPWRACSSRRSSSRRGPSISTSSSASRPTAIAWAPSGLATRHREGPPGRLVQALVQLPDRGRREVDRLDRRLRSGSRRPSPAATSRPAPARAPTALRSIGARQHRDRPVLGGHRDPVLGLGHHRGLAGDRVAQYREAVGGADREGVEAVEVVEAAAQRRLEVVALATAARSDSRPRPRSRCRSGTRFPRGAAPRAAGCGWRASRCGPGRGRGPVENGCECSVVTRLSVAIRVWPSACVADDPREPEALDELARVDRLLVDLDPLADAHHPQLRVVLGASQRLDLSPSPATTNSAWEARTSGPPRRRSSPPAPRQLRPRLLGLRREQRDLAGSGRGRVAVERDPGTVGAAVGELREHRAQVSAESAPRSRSTC